MKALAKPARVLSEYDVWRGKTDRQLASDYLSGNYDEKAWWIRHWQWSSSEYWKRCCEIHEAICLLAWELSEPAVLTHEDVLAFEAVAKLNSHVRTLSGLESKRLRDCIYWLKREAISWAMYGARNRCIVMRPVGGYQVFIRRVEVQAPCRRCDRGVFYGWHWSPGDQGERCRRCSGTGIATLHFCECNVADRFTFHLPYDSSHPFKGVSLYHLQARPAGAWKPNEPGKTLSTDDLITAITFLRERYWRWQPDYVHEIYKDTMNVPVEALIA